MASELSPDSSAGRRRSLQQARTAIACAARFSYSASISALVRLRQPRFRSLVVVVYELDDVAVGILAENLPDSEFEVFAFVELEAGSLKLLADHF